MDIETLIKLIAKALEVSETEVSIDTESSDIEAWDSLGHIQVMMEIQNHFGEGYVENPDLAAATSVSDIFEIVKT